MFSTRNFQLIETNCCPDCALPYVRHGVGHPDGIHCQNCGYTVPMKKYQEVMKAYWAKINQTAQPDEELNDNEAYV